MALELLKEFNNKIKDFSTKAAGGYTPPIPVERTEEQKQKTAAFQQKSKEAVGAVGGFFKDVGQSIARNVGLISTKAITGDINRPLTATNKFTQALTGLKPGQESTFTSEAEPITDLVGVKKGSIVTPIIGGAFALLDASLIGGPAKKLAVTGFKKIAETVEKKEIVRTLENTFGYTAKEAEEIAPRFENRINTQDDVARIIEDDFASKTKTVSIQNILKNSDDFEIAQKNISKGIEPMTYGPIRVSMGKNGELNLVDGNNRLAKAISQGKTEVPVFIENAPRISILPTASIADDTVKYIAENIAKREAARTTDEVSGLLGKTNELVKELKKKIDSVAPIEDLLREALKKNKSSVLESQDITNNIDRVLRAPTLAGAFIKRNKLDEVIKNVNDLDEFDEYLVARQASDVNTRGVETGRDFVRDQKLLRELGPKYEQYAKQVTAYSQKILDYGASAGIINKNLAQALKERYPNYVPINRIFSEIEREGSKLHKINAAGIANVSAQTIVQALKGSPREIESPMASLITKTYNAFLQGEKNKAFQTLVSYKNIPGNPFQLRKIKKGSDAKSDMSYITGFENGKKVFYETSKEIADAAKAFDVQQLNILGRILAFPVRVLKAGVTGVNVVFASKNIIRDQLTAFINSKHGLKTSIANPPVFLKALTSAIRHDELYDEFVESAAGGTSFDIGRNQAIETVKSIRSGKNKASKALYLAKNPGQLFRAIEDIFARPEELTRLQQYEGTKKTLMKQGLSRDEATLAAARAARENTANFYRKGDWGKIINSTFPYLNAGIQGSRAFIRSFSRNPKSTAAKVAATLLMPEAMTTAWALSDEKRKEAWNDIAEYEKENNFIIIPPVPTKDAQGRWNVIKIPKPPGISNFTNFVRRPMEQMAGLNPVKFNEMANSLIGIVSPVEPSKQSLMSTLVPQAIKPSVESFANKNFYSGLPIVSPSEEQRSPALQYRDYTSGTVRLLGEKADMSPLKIEAFIRGTFGGVGMQGLNLIDKALAGADIIPDDQIGGQDITDAISDAFTTARGGIGEVSINDKAKNILKQQTDERFILKLEAEALFSELSRLPREEANAKTKELKSVNPLLYDKLKEVKEDRDMGRTYTDSLMLQMGVENGQRARFIYEQLKSLDTPEKKNAYISDLQSKKVITKKVRAQIKALKKAGEKQGE